MVARDLQEGRLHLTVAGKELGVLTGHLGQQGPSRCVNERDSPQIDLEPTAPVSALLLIPAVPQDVNPRSCQLPFDLETDMLAKVMCGDS